MIIIKKWNLNLFLHCFKRIKNQNLTKLLHPDSHLHEIVSNKISRSGNKVIQNNYMLYFSLLIFFSS